MKTIKQLRIAVFLTALIFAASQSSYAQVPAKPGLISGARYGVCNLAFTYSVAPVNNATGYTWTASAGTIVSGQGTNAIVVSFPVTTATIIISVTADNANGSSPVRTTNVRGKPAVPGPVIATPSDWCAGSNGIQFYSDISGLVGTYTLQWSWNPVPAAGNATGLNSNLMTLDWYSQTNHAVVRMRATNACGTSTTYFTGAVTCGQNANRSINPDQGEEESMETNTVVYPNPSNGNVNVFINAPGESGYTIRVVDVAGRIVHSEEVSAAAGENNYNVDLKGFTNGIYSVLISGDGINEVNRISIQ